MNHIGKSWELFAKKVMPANPAENQYMAMKQAFFAGAAILFSDIVERLDDPARNAGDGAKYMSEIDAEITAFAAKVASGDMT